MIFSELGWDSKCHVNVVVRRYTKKIDRVLASYNELLLVLYRDFVHENGHPIAVIHCKKFQSVSMVSSLRQFKYLCYDLRLTKSLVYAQLF
jgi:hypothetical protein